MGDRLSGVSLTEADFMSMIQNFVGKGDIKKKVDVEVNGSKEIEKLTNNFEKLNSIRTDQLTGQLEKISTLLSVRFKGVNLNQFTSKLIRAFQDPTKSAEDLSSTINDVYTNLTTLASIDNSGSFVGFSESEIRRTIKKQQKVLELQKQFESEYSNASTKTKKQKPVDIITRARVEKIQKQSSSDVAASLGVDSSKIDVKNGDDTLLQTYQQTADLLAKMVSEKKEYNKLNKANVGDYLKQEQDILSVFQQLQDIEKQISEKFGISSKDFLSNQFEGDNGQFDFVKNAEQAVKTYVTIMTSSTKKALQEAQTKLSEQLNTAATKSVDRLGTANEKVGKTSERLGGSVGSSGDSTTVQAGAEIGESVAIGMEKAEAATESTTKNIQNYILSLEQSIGAIQELYNEIARLDKEMDNPDITDKRYHELEKEIDSKYLEIAKHRQNVHRLGKSDSFINTKLNTEYDIEDIGIYVNPQIDKNKKIKEELDSIRKYVESEPVEASMKIVTPEETQQLEETKSSLQIILDYLNQLNTQSLKGLVDDFSKLPEPIKAAADELGLLNKEKNGFDISNNGGENHGVIVGDNTLISRTGTQQKYEDILELKRVLDQAAEAGVNVSRILDVVFDSKKNTILELQKTVPGQVISNIGLNGDSTDNLSFNEALLQATDEQIIKLITDIEKLNSLGIDVDFNDSNFLYDKEKGFSIIDLKMKGANSSDFGSSELLDMFSYIKDEFDYAGKDTSAIDTFIERIKTAITLRNELQKPGGNTGLLETTDSEEKLNALKTELQSLREELQRFKDTGVEPEGISELQTKLESAEQHIRSLSDELSLLYEHSVSESDYSRLEEELSLAKANAEDLRESLVQVKSELEQSKIEAPLDSDALDKKVTELQYLHDKVRTIFDGPDGIVNEDMTYSEKFNSSEVQRMIELLNQLSDAELRATGVMPDDEDSYNTFRYNLQAEVDAIKETQEMLQQAYDTGNYDGFDASEIDVSIWNRLEHIYEMAQEVTNQFDSKLTPAVREFLGLVEGEIGSENMVGFLGEQNIDSYVNDIISGAKTAKEAFADLENSFGWDTARFDSLIPIEVPQELKGLYDSLFSDVENRIKSAEQAAAEFNAELAKLSTSGNVSASADQSAQSDIQAAAAAEQRAQANEHLAESEKQVNTAESSNTGTQGTPGQTDASVTESAIDAEMSKLDQLKNKIATEIPQAIGIKNNAFRDEQSVVESVISAEVEALTKLEGGLKGVTDAAKNKAKAFQEKAQSQKTSDNTKTNTGKTQTDDKKQKSEQDIRNEQDAKMLKEYNTALDEYLKLEQQRVNLLKQKGNVELSQAQQDNQIAALNKMVDIQKRWNSVQGHSTESQERFNAALKRSNDEQQRLATQYKANFNDRLKADIKYSGRMTTYNTLLNESKMRPEAFTDAMGEMGKKVKELQNYFPINPTDDESIHRVHELSDEIEQMAKEIRANPEYKNAKDTAQAALSKKAEQWATNNSAAINADPEGFERIRQAIADINTLSDQNEASRMLDEFIAKSNAAGKAGASFADTLKQRFKSLGAYLLSFASFYRVIGWVREAVQTITELDTAMVELKKVSNESAKSYSDFMKQSFDMADEVGTTSEQIIQSTADWKRLGRSFEESKKLAQQSTVLMNVSEFENINDATEAMVSATQAYTDVASEDIIDKLNHVGNNFAVGTSELATGLQNAAAVLKTQGNDIDEALALLTAGNLIGQDMSKASAGIRTISLRISGTEEAKDEIAEMGEDVDDFVVRTKSKTDQIIRDYTAVASNAHQGISVLDDNGNLRDTYSILLDISKIYKEIQEEDKKYGTNRAQALVETLAGKNRSNIASSILLNGDILESVYNASKNESQGSAQHELDTYLDSIEGKTAKLQNRLQELTSTAIDSEFIKTVIDGLTKILELANSLIDTFGLLPTVLSGIGSVLLQKSGNGLFNYNKTEKSWTFGFQKLIEKVTTNIKFPNDAMAKVFAQMDPNKVYNTQLSDLASKGVVIPQEMYNTEAIEGYSAAVTTAGEAMEAYGVKTAGASGLLNNFNAIAGTVASTLLSMASSMIAMWAIGKLFSFIGSGIDSIVHKRENTIKGAEEAQQDIDDIINKNQARKDFNNNDEKYERLITLSSKVTTDENGYKNISATNEEYEEYISLCNEIAGIYPTVVSSYDAQGNAIVNLGDSAKETREQVEALNRASLSREYTELKGSVNKTWAGNKLKLADAEEAKKTAQAQVDANQETIDLLNESDKQNSKLMDELKKIQSEGGVDINTGSMNITEITALQNSIRDAAKKAGIDDNLLRIGGDVTNGIMSISSYGNYDEETWTKFYDEISINIPSAASDAESAILESDADLQAAISQGQQILQEQLNNSLELLTIDPKFLNLDEHKEIQEAIKNSFLGLTEEELPDTDNIEQWAIDNFIEPISYAFTSSKGGEAQDAISNLFKDGIKNMSVGDYDKYLNHNLDTIKDFYKSIGREDLYESFIINFDFAFKTPDGSIIYNDKDALIRDIQDYLPDKLTDDDRTQLTALTWEQLINVHDLLNDDSFAGGLAEALKKATQKAVDIAPTDTLSTLINDESYKSSTENLSSDLSSLTGALETLRTEGSLTSEQMVELQNSFPDLTEFTTEAIQTKAFEKLNEWIGKIREGMKGMSEEGKEQARIMIQNMIDQYGDLGVSVGDIMDSYVGSGGSASVFSNKFEKLKSDLAAEGLELDTHVLYTLVAQDEFSGTADQILEKYKDVKINWDLILESKELENDINRLQSQISNQQAKNSRKEANGGILNSGDYYDLITLSNGVASDRQIQYENAKRRYDNVKDNKYIDKAFKDNLYQQMVDAETEFINAQVEVANNEKSAIESQANGMLQVLKRRENDVTKAQNALTDAENKYGEGNAPEEFYSNLQDALYSRANVNTFLSHMYEAMAQANPKYRDEFMEQASSYSSSAQSDTESAKGYDNSESQKELNSLQEDATKIQRNLTLAEQNHQKVSKSTYNALIHNAKDQIKLLKEEQEGVKDNLSEWRNYQDQIDSLNDSIYEWGTTSESLFYDQASQLASAISSAMSESISETGLTDDTINALKTAFSDLDGSKFDVSDAFYSTADGVKVNTEALQELTEAEFELIGAPLANEIANVQAQLEKDPGNSALQDKLENLMETNAKYFAQYEEMQKALSRNAAIDLAEGTSNAGANYDENYGRVKTYKEAYENGLTGTDDFKAWTSYLDVYGRDTLEAYESVSGKINRYFTEDASEGLGNFLTDMEKLGYAAQDADGYWTITADDYDAAAKDMQMGSEWFMDTMRKLEDFGFIHTHVDSLNEAQLKTRDVEEQIADAVQTYSEMVARGASDEELQKQIEHINELESQWQDLDTVTKTWGETTEENRKKEFLGLGDQLAGFEEVYKNATTDAAREEAKKSAQDYAKQFRMTLDEEDLAKGIFRLSDESAEDYASRITEFSGSIENPLTAEDMGISEENVSRFEKMKGGIQELAQSGDLSSIQEALSGLTAEQLKGIDYDDKKYTEGFEAAESAVDQLRESLGLGVEDTDLLIDAMTALGLVVDQKVDVPTQFDTLDNFLATATKGSGAGYQISTDVSRLSTDELQTQLSEISTLEVQIDPDSDVYNQLQELKKQTEIQLNIKNSDQTQTQLKEWAEAGDRENIAKTFGIDVNSEEVDKYIEQINNMPSDYDLAIHIDDSQFQTLIESITGEPYQAEVEVVGKDKVTTLTNKIQQKLQSNPITQPIVQKVQSFGQKVKQAMTATVNTGDSNKQVDKVENNVENLNKTSGTAKVNVDVNGALSNIQKVRSQLLSLNSVTATPRVTVDTSNAYAPIFLVKSMLDQLRDKTVTLTTRKVTVGSSDALGTAHSLGTTSLSRAYANGKDWTVGRDESALVNEIGQESRVRDGVWELIPGGPHVEDLKKDDIIN